MLRLLILAAVVLMGWKLVTGRWPWERWVDARGQALLRARRLLGVGNNASRAEIVEAHRRLIVLVHPDRGGTNEQVHEANSARDLLFAELPYQPPEDSR